MCVFCRRAKEVVWNDSGHEMTKQTDDCINKWPKKRRERKENRHKSWFSRFSGVKITGSRWNFQDSYNEQLSSNIFFLKSKRESFHLFVNEVLKVHSDLGKGTKWLGFIDWKTLSESLTKLRWQNRKDLRESAMIKWRVHQRKCLLSWKFWRWGNNKDSESRECWWRHRGIVLQAFSSTINDQCERPTIQRNIQTRKCDTDPYSQRRPDSLWLVPTPTVRWRATSPIRARARTPTASQFSTEGHGFDTRQCSPWSYPTLRGRRGRWPRQAWPRGRTGVIRGVTREVTPGRPRPWGVSRRRGRRQGCSRRNWPRSTRAASLNTIMGRSRKRLIIQ